MKIKSLCHPHTPPDVIPEQTPQPPYSLNNFLHKYHTPTQPSVIPTPSVAPKYAGMFGFHTLQGIIIAFPKKKF